MTASRSTSGSVPQSRNPLQGGESGGVGLAPAAPPRRLSIAEAAGSLIAIALFGVLLAQIVLRSLGAPLVWVEEFSTLAFVLLVFVGAAAAFQRGEHLEVDLLFRWAEKRMRPGLLALWTRMTVVLQLVFLLVLAIGLAFMARQAWNLHAGTLPGFRYGWLYVAVLIAIVGAMALLTRQLVRSRREQRPQ